MVIGKHSKSLVKAKGSPELNKKLLTGDAKRISEAFGHSYPIVRGTIIGNQFGDINVVRCAEALASYYEKIGLRDKVKQIISEHANK